MFAKLVASLITLALATSAVASPVAAKREVAARGFSKWGGISSLDGFDDFYGEDGKALISFTLDDIDNVVVDYAHHKHFSPVVIKQSNELVCHSQQVVIIQQRLAVLQEMAKRIITEQICEVETQTIVFQQYHASLGSFSHDLTRSSGHAVGYDHDIASHFENIYNSDGSLSDYDFGFKGSDIGSHYYTPSSNWGDNSYSSVGSAYQAAQIASYY
ncbi:Amidohydro-rel domain-containing protein [Mycena kentingensis (nom. inval.)]|nr:Amidohydro-rel domain-containing protein [Mycena kentingensis (nom. inval.)]